MYNIRDYNRFWHLLAYASRLCSLLAVAYFLAFSISPLRATDERYSMHFGYSMLLPIMYSITSPKMLDKLLSVVMLVVVLLVGSRGSAGMAVLFYGVYFLCFNRKGLLKLALPLVILLPFIAMEVKKVFDVESSRTLTIVMSGELVSHDSGRGEIWKMVEDKISERPLIGWGIGADRAFIDSYAHNFILELAMHYGVFITAIIILILAYFIITAFKSKNANRVGGWVFVVMMMLYGLVPLMFSNSYLIDYKFATFVGVLLSAHRKGYHQVAQSVLRANGSYQIAKV